MESLPAKHVVQFYGDNDRALAANVARYLAAGLKQGDGLLMIAEPSRMARFLDRLKLEVPYEDAIRTGRLLCLDAAAVLADVMVDGQPEWSRFEHVIGGAIKDIQRCTSHARFRAYGETVDLLWKAGQTAAAIQFEEYWNTLLAASADGRLFCAYSIDILGRDFEPATVAPILCTHAQVLAVGEGLELAVDMAVEEVLGPGIEELGRYGESGWATLPRTVATILWLKDQRPADAEQVLRRARHYYYELE